MEGSEQRGRIGRILWKDGTLVSGPVGSREPSERAGAADAETPEPQNGEHRTPFWCSAVHG